MKSFFLLFLFLAGAASSVFGGDVFWEYVCESKVLPSDKKKEYAIRSQEAFQAFSQTAKLTPENLDFIRTQGWLRGIDFEQSLWYNPDLSYDALNHVSPQSAVLRTAFEISEGLRGRKEESFFVDLFSSPKLTIQEKIRLLGYFRRNGGNFTLSAKKKLWESSEGNKLFRMFLFDDDKGEITGEYFDFFFTRKELHYLIAERGSARQIQRLFQEIGSINFWSNETFVRALLERRGDVDIDSFLKESTLIGMLTDKKLRLSCLETFLSKYDFSSGKIDPQTLIPFIKYVRERMAIAFNPTVSESVRIPFFKSLCFSEVFFREESNFSKEAQLQIIESDNLEAIRILLICRDFDWTLFPHIKYKAEELKCAILLNPDAPHSVRASISKCIWGKDELEMLLEKATWLDLPIDLFKTLYENAQDDPSMLKLLLLSSNLPNDYRKKIFNSLEDDPDIFSFVSERLILSPDEMEKFCEKRLKLDAQAHKKKDIRRTPKNMSIDED